MVKESTGNRYHAYQRNGYDYHGKSIRKEKIEEAFAETVRWMIPSLSLFNLAKNMFANIWERRLAQAVFDLDELSDKLIHLDQKKVALMKRLVAATCDDVASAYEDEIARIAQEKRLLRERCEAALEPRKPFAECFHAAMDSIANPWLFWERGTFEHKRLLLRLTILVPIPFSRENGFSNPELSLPFKLLGSTDMQNRQIVPGEDSCL